MSFFFKLDTGYLFFFSAKKFYKIPLNLNAYKNFLLNTDADYVGSRLHGGVYALHHFRRSIILEIDYRVREMKKTYNLPSVARRDISTIKSMINSEFDTEIIIDYKKIRDWKNQFV